MNNKSIALLILTLIVFFLCNGCSVKYGQYKMDDSFIQDFLETDNYLSFEGEWLFWETRMGLSIGAGGLLNARSEGKLDTSYGGVQGSTPEAELYFHDVFTTARFFPFKRIKKGFIPIPFLGTGFSYYKMGAKYKSKGAYSGSDGFYNYYRIDESSETFAEGFNPHIVAGFQIPIHPNKNSLALVFEYRYEINRTDGKVDLSGNTINIGFSSPFYE